jgi:mRNA interferase MazF
MAPLVDTPRTGLKVPSVVRFDKLATLDRAVIAGKIGEAPAEWLASHRPTFFGVFGFGQP